MLELNGVEADLQLLMIDTKDRKLRLAVRIERRQAFGGRGQIRHGVADSEGQRLVFAERLSVDVADRSVQRDGVDRAPFRHAPDIRPTTLNVRLSSRPFGRDSNLRIVESLQVELIVELD